MHISTSFALLNAGIALAVIKLPDIPADKSTPVQQRLSLNGPGSVAVAWNTYEKLDKPCVQYGRTTNLTSTACSTKSTTYSTSRTWNNLVILKDLLPATKYYYRIGSTNHSVDWFLSGREAGDRTPFTMMTYADLGVYGAGGYTTKKRSEIPGVQPSLNHTTIGSLASKADEFEIIAHPGDLGYADDWTMTDFDHSKDKESAFKEYEENDYKAITETFFEQLAPISSRKLYMVSPGNHEATCDENSKYNSMCPGGQSNFSDFHNRFDQMMPSAYPLSSKTNSTAAQARQKAMSLAQPPFWYSFDYGMAHVVMFDTETDFANAPDEPGGYADLNGGPFGKKNQQIDFLNADLSSVDRTVTPWVIVAGHRPWYSNGPSTASCKPCQEAFEDIFYKYGVDIAAFGHVHNMQRFEPMYKGKVDPAGLKNPKAPLYTIVGGAGNIEGHSTITPKAEGNVFAYKDTYGYGSLTFHNCTNVQVKFYNAVDGSVLDDTMLYKAHNQSFVVQSIPSSSAIDPPPSNLTFSNVLPGIVDES